MLPITRLKNKHDILPLQLAAFLVTGMYHVGDLSSMREFLLH